MTARLILTAAIAIAPAQAQFEVASVKPSAPDAKNGSIRRDPAGGLVASGVTLQTLVLLAYQVQSYQLSGAPGWMQSDRFDVIAKPPAGAKKDQTWIMLRRLLEDRFKLAVHRETKDLPVYELQIAKNGVKLQESTREPNEADGGFSSGKGKITGEKIPMESLAFVLCDVVGRKVFDRTGIAGKFDIKLQWTPGIDPDSPTVFVALQEQLGLKLSQSKAPIETLFVDRVEKPTAN